MPGYFQTHRVAKALLLLCLTSMLVSAQTVVIPVPANSMAYSNRFKKLFVTASNTAPAPYSNAVLQVNPETGEIEKYVYVGSGPDKVTVGAGGEQLFVSTGGGHIINSIEIATLTKGTQVDLGNATVVQMFSHTSVPEGVIVQTKNGQYDYRLTPYIRGKAVCEPAGCMTVLFPTINHFRFFSYETQISPAGSSQLLYLPGSLKQTSGVGGPFNGVVQFFGSAFGVSITHAGDVFDPETRQTIGSPGCVAPLGESTSLSLDPLRPYVYELKGSGDKMVLGIYSLLSYSKLSQVPIPPSGLGGPASGLMRWGSSGFAYRQEGQVVCTQMELGPTANSVDLAIQRSRPIGDFVAGGVVRYQLKITNLSEVESSDAYVSDSLPSGIEVQETTCSQGSVSSANGSIRANLGPISKAKEATIDVIVRMGKTPSRSFVAVVRSFDIDTDTFSNVAFPFGASTQTPTPKESAPDLSASWEQVTQRSIGSGVDLRSVVVGRAIIVNKGAKPSSRCLVRFYVQDGPSLVVPWATLLQEVELPSLAPGQSIAVELNAPLGAGDATGSFVIVTVDPTNPSGDTEKSNNNASANI